MRVPLQSLCARFAGLLMSHCGDSHVVQIGKKRPRSLFGQRLRANLHRLKKSWNRPLAFSSSSPTLSSSPSVSWDGITLRDFGTIFHQRSSFTDVSINSSNSAETVARHLIVSSPTSSGALPVEITRYLSSEESSGSEYVH